MSPRNSTPTDARSPGYPNSGSGSPNSGSRRQQDVRSQLLALEAAISSELERFYRKGGSGASLYVRGLEEVRCVLAYTLRTAHHPRFPGSAPSEEAPPPPLPESGKYSLRALTRGFRMRAQTTALAGEDFVLDYGHEVLCLEREGRPLGVFVPAGLRQRAESEDESRGSSRNGRRI